MLPKLVTYRSLVVNDLTSVVATVAELNNPLRCFH